MKRIILLAIVTVLTTAVYAQTEKEDLAIVQSVFQKQKADLVKQNLQLSDAQSQVFWPIYEEYEGKRVNLSTQRSAIIADYLKGYDTLTDQESDDLANRVFANDKSLTDLQKSYFKKFSKAIGGKNAAKFYQLESYLQAIIRVKVQDNIPFIGELDKTTRQ
ncbi:hypothetical protein [Mucilaginibacter agri]|uniref:Peptidylprolyl isomerase n=1 Tax=Mucilaginibacter agri TaxID=2695265 RepID=A0A966DUH3_9SPHI|nr:hypothetical protein [Mucilaginibacter agri]NCD72368.1 hypothetical protein [Mucilaginibacter agri]